MTNPDRLFCRYGQSQRSHGNDCQKTIKKTRNGVSNFVTVRGKTIAYKDEGAGTPVVLPQSSHMWRKVVSTIATNHRVIMIDLPGLGESQGYDAYDTRFVADV